MVVGGFFRSPAELNMEGGQAATSGEIQLDCASPAKALAKTGKGKVEYVGVPEWWNG
jgi:hypothetical protein